MCDNEILSKITGNFIWQKVYIILNTVAQCFPCFILYVKCKVSHLDGVLKAFS